MSAQFFSIILLHTKSFEDHNRPHALFFKMLLNKSIISVVAAIALASSVASLSPCKTGTLTCCVTKESFSSLQAQQQQSLKQLDPSVNPDLSVGVNCNAAAQYW